MSPALARWVAAKDRGQQIARPGGYFGTLIDDALAEAATSHQRRQRELADAEHRELADTKEAIRDPDRVPDAELASLAERCQLTDFSGGPDALRDDPAFLNELARERLAQDRSGTPDEQQRHRAGGRAGAVSTAPLCSEREELLATGAEHRGPLSLGECKEAAVHES